MKHVGVGAFVALALMGSGCTWQRIDPPPVFHGPQMPVRVGVKMSTNLTSVLYGPGMVKCLSTWQAFESVAYPYRPGDKVGAVLDIRVRGRWVPDTSGNLWRGFLIGLSMFTLSPAMGLSMTGRHDLDVSMKKDAVEVARYHIHQETSVTWGLFASLGKVLDKADDLQVSRLAYALIQRLQADWPRLRKKLGK